MRLVLVSSTAACALLFHYTICIVLRQHSRINLSLLQHQSTSEERQWILQDLSLQCHSSSYKNTPEERQGRVQDPSLQYQ